MISEKQKVHYINNKDAIDKHNKQYYIDNKARILEQRKSHYEAYETKRKEPFTCECGSIIQHRDKACHNKSKKHIAFINTIIV